MTVHSLLLRPRSGQPFAQLLPEPPCDSFARGRDRLAARVCDDLTAVMHLAKSAALLSRMGLATSVRRHVPVRYDVALTVTNPHASLLTYVVRLHKFERFKLQTLHACKLSFARMPFKRGKV